MLHSVTAASRACRSFSLFVALTALALAAGCTKVTARQGEGLACSRSSDENPHFICDPARGLSCVTTYATHTDTPIDVYICRTPCTPTTDGTAPACPYGGDICCPGKTTDGKPTFVCVQGLYCAAVPQDNPDASPPPVRRDGGIDASPADGAPAVDAPNERDATSPADAPVGLDAADDVVNP